MECNYDPDEEDENVGFDYALEFIKWLWEFNLVIEITLLIEFILIKILNKAEWFDSKNKFNIGYLAMGSYILK